MNAIYDAKWLKAEGKRRMFRASSKRVKYRAVEFFKDFTLAGKVSEATLDITALGVFNAYLNGKKAGDDVLCPGWTSYATRLQYFTYDVSDLLRADETNELTVEIGTGWRFHNVKEWATDEIDGDGIALLCALSVKYADGRTERLVSDESWRARYSKVVFNHIYDGEKVDYTAPGEEAAVKVFTHPKSVLIPAEGERVREREIFSSPKLIITPKGEKVLDFGQEITGYVEFRGQEKRGTVITLRHFETLDKHGNVYTANLRSAKQTVTVIAADEGFVFKPRFTFYGFRYVEVEGIEKVSPADFRAIAVYSDIKRTSTFECSEPMLNKLYENVLWGQRGNFLDVPTDCPQRDERLGWTGDAQVFAKTAAINFDVKKFFVKWLDDLAAEQKPDGNIPNTCPVNKFRNGYGSTGWADAAVIVPWELYLAYGDAGILRRYYPMMKGWVDYMAHAAEANARGTGKDFVHPWRGKGHYGDWLALDNGNDEAVFGRTDQGLIATAYLAGSAEILIKTGKLLGENVDYYEKLREDAAEFFRKEYMCGGRMKQDTETACVLALEFGLSKDPIATAAQLDEYVGKAGGLNTGFLGTAYLLYALSSNGYALRAYDLLLKKTPPSWLYPITKGATTVWERWNSIKPDGSFASAGMNSLNHYAYGAVFGWMFANLVGINYDESAPGYARVVYAPIPDKRITRVKGSIETARGTVSAEYELKDGAWRFVVTIPAGAEAVARISGKERALMAGVNEFSIEA